VSAIEQKCGFYNPIICLFLFLFLLEEGNMASALSLHPWILGNLVFYAPDLQAASQAYEQVTSEKPNYAFGTVTLLTGEVVDWVNLRFEDNSTSGCKAQ
jgi:hypothetical protein